MQKNDEWSRRNFLVGSAWIAAAGLAAPLLSACAGSVGTPSSAGSGGSLLDELRKKGFVDLGIFGSQVYGFTDKSGRVTGEGPEVVRAIFAKLGVPEVRAKQLPFDQLIPALNAGQFDIIGGGMYITPARCKNALFSRPDYTMPEALLVPKGNPKGLLTLADAASKGVKLSYLTGTVEATYAKAAGVKQENLIPFDAQQALLESVTTGRGEAAILPHLSLKALVSANPDAPVELTPSFTPVVDGKPVRIGGAFVFRQDEKSQKLVDEVNRELGALHDSGEWLKIVEPFGLTKEHLPPKDLTMQQLCSAT